ncbi:nucleotide exchange factor GrpE [Tsuneonella sp. YG55]|uniref:Protein GrpE n=1 Tax=Tsuneonella litorea TaxID=2976475 RepID=A0A9X3AKU4_9SPHN|nr:nucleotide exchange factor GrpE [Tsuneonella litorea]MCT2558829.1 nucleotide exchange factor GrpE [Tsuneonella litorea]
MIEDDKQAADEAVAKELDGVPADMIDDEGKEEEGSLSDALSALKDDLDKANQDILYARAETQNVRRRLEKDIADARAYAATGFARDILSVYDNLVRAIEAIPPDLHDDPRMKAMVTGIEATQREVEKVFASHGITRIASTGLPLDPNQHQAMLEIPTEEHEPGTVVQEMQSGWMIKNRLLRPAMVGVAKKP